MYIVTGGAGFIGSVLVRKLNEEGIDDIIIVDDLDKSDKWKNLINSKYTDYINKNDFKKMMEGTKNYGIYAPDIDAIIHLGACSSTTEKDSEYLMENNFHYTKMLSEFCDNFKIKFIYASSAATYGDGSLGFDDNIIDPLKPLNMYGYSKQIFDVWLNKRNFFKSQVGLKFFNVFGPNEYHKGDMISIVYKLYKQILNKKPITLFKSHRPDFENGGQRRDFIYVKDCADIIWWFIKNKTYGKNYGIYNVGTGKSVSYLDLVRIIGNISDLKYPYINYIDMPKPIRNQYQYFTEAKIDKLKAITNHNFLEIEESVEDYIKNYLNKDL